MGPLRTIPLPASHLPNAIAFLFLGHAHVQQCLTGAVSLTSSWGDSYGSHQRGNSGFFLQFIFDLKVKGLCAKSLKARMHTFRTKVYYLEVKITLYCTVQKQKWTHLLNHTRTGTLTLPTLVAQHIINMYRSIWAGLQRCLVNKEASGSSKDNHYITLKRPGVSVKRAQRKLMKWVNPNSRINPNSRALRISVSVKRAQRELTALVPRKTFHSTGRFLCSAIDFSAPRDQATWARTRPIVTHSMEPPPTYDNNWSPKLHTSATRVSLRLYYLH